MRHRIVKRSIAFLLAAACLLQFAGCMPPYDYGMNTIMLVEAPCQLIYVATTASELDLSYGKVQTIREHGFDDIYILNTLGFLQREYMHTDIDFDKKGAYLVNIAKKSWGFTRKRYFQFTIQIIPAMEYYIDRYVPEDRFHGEETEPTYCENVTAIMTSPPDNIVYPVGYEGEIDPAGIVVRAASGWFPRRYAIEKLDYTLESDVDFNTPGSYIVRVDYTDPKGGEHWFIFTVAVAKKVK